MTLHIHIQEGFSGERVVIRVNGRDTFDDVAVTRIMTGIACTFETNVSADPADVEVRVPSRGLAASFTVDASRTPHLGLALRGGAITHRLSDRPFVSL